MSAAKNKAGTEALTTYELARRLAKRLETAYLAQQRPEGENQDSTADHSGSDTTAGHPESDDAAGHSFPVPSGTGDGVNAGYLEDLMTRSK